MYGSATVLMDTCMFSCHVDVWIAPKYCRTSLSACLLIKLSKSLLVSSISATKHTSVHQYTSAADIDDTRSDLDSFIKRHADKPVLQYWSSLQPGSLHFYSDVFG